MPRPLSEIVAVCASIALAGAAPNAPQPGKAYPSCHVHKSQPVHFANATSKDLLEISIGTGPCYAATLSIVVRSEYGEILYAYVDRFKKHVATHWADEGLPDSAAKFVDDELSNAVYPASDLPKWEEPNDYYESNYQTVQIPKARYEVLKRTKAPILSHRTYYEGWRTVTYDETAKKAVIVTQGGL